MKRKRTDSTLISSTRAISPTKLVALPIGSTVEIQLDDGKWHSGVVIQCQTKKCLVQVDEQQLWTDCELLRTGSAREQKRSAPFEYRPGQFLRHESRPGSKIGPGTAGRGGEEKTSPSPNDSNETSAVETKRKRIPRLSPSNATTEPKKSPFVWKPSTATSTIQTRRASKNGQLAPISADDNSPRTRPSSEEKALPANSVPAEAEPVPPSEVLIFRPIIRFVESTDEEEIPFKASAVGDENALTQGPASRSSSRTSSDHLYLNGSSECQQSKSEGKSSCFLETPPPSLPDIHLTQESESPQDKQPNKSKRKQDRPQRKSLAQPAHALLDRLPVKPDEQEESTKASSDLADPGYLSDEYGEPATSSRETSVSTDLERFYRRLLARDDHFAPTDSPVFNDDDRTFCGELVDYLSSNGEHYQRLEQYRLQSYHDESNPRIELISNILKELFLLGSSHSLLLRPIFQTIPNEIKTHLRLCLNNVVEENAAKKKILPRGKRLSQTGLAKARPIKGKRTSTGPDLHEQQLLLSPASPLTPSSSSKQLTEQPSTEDLLSPNETTTPAGVIEELTVLPKERDVYEIIHCLCQCQIDNGFMIQCESCLCWSHCECVGVTATCIPAFFKCKICSKAEAERNATGALSSLFDDEMTSCFGLTPNNAEKIARILFYSRQLADLREQMIELKLRSTPDLRRLQHEWRSDDLMELAKYSPIQSDRWSRKTDERKKKREHFQTVAQTIDAMIDDVCQSTRVSSCPSIDVRRTRSDGGDAPATSDSMELLINHLCDDPETREIRSIIEQRYRQMINDVDEKLEKILSEHQNIEKEMKFELGISPDDRSDEYLSYQTYESALRTALERFKSS